MNQASQKASASGPADTPLTWEQTRALIVAHGHNRIAQVDLSNGALRGEFVAAYHNAKLPKTMGACNEQQRALISKIKADKSAYGKPPTRYPFQSILSPGAAIFPTTTAF